MSQPDDYQLSAGSPPPLRPEIQVALEGLESPTPMVAVAPLEHSAAFLLFELQERRHRRLYRLAELGHQDLLDAYLSQANLMHGLGSSFLLKGSDVRPNLALLNDLTDQIRAVSGYADFLGPVTPDSLWALGYHDPVVYLLAGPEMGYALVFQTSNPPRYGLIRLPQFTRQAVFDHGLRCRFLYEREEDYEVTLQQLEIEASWCWKACMRDVCSAFHAGSRLTMIPLEYATFLPLHLAWTRDAGAITGRRYALDHLVLSYAPSLRIAGHVRRLPVPRTTSPLAAIAPSADGDLPYSGPEVRYTLARGMDESLWLMSKRPATHSLRRSVARRSCISLDMHGARSRCPGPATCSCATRR